MERIAREGALLGASRGQLLDDGHRNHRHRIHDGARDNQAELRKEMVQARTQDKLGSELASMVIDQ